MNSSHELFADSYLIVHTVSPKHSGSRIDAFLKKIYRRKSREKIKGFIDDGGISVVRLQSPHLSVGKIKPSTLLVAGDEVHVLTPRKPEPPVNFDYKILYEDEHFLIIDKPAPLPVHPAGRYFFHTLLTHLKTRGFTTPLKADRELYLAHRIDKETSGVLVLTKSREVCNHLVKQFFSRQTEKTYYAVVHGLPPLDEFEINFAMNRKENSPIGLQMYLIPESEGGLPALTRCEVMKRFHDPVTGRNFALLLCKPKTGRQHQIRLHLQAAGFPIVGDKLYSLSPDLALRFYDQTSYHGKTFYRLSPEMMGKLILNRHALHAASIRFRHPYEDKWLDFSSDLPPDLATFLDSLSVITPQQTLQTPLRSEPSLSMPASLSSF